MKASDKNQITFQIILKTLLFFPSILIFTNRSFANCENQGLSFCCKKGAIPSDEYFDIGPCFVHDDETSEGRLYIYKLKNTSLLDVVDSFESMQDNVKSTVFPENNICADNYRPDQEILELKIKVILSDLLNLNPVISLSKVQLKRILDTNPSHVFNYFQEQTLNLEKKYLFEKIDRDTVSKVRESIRENEEKKIKIIESILSLENPEKNHNQIILDLVNAYILNGDEVALKVENTIKNILKNSGTLKKDNISSLDFVIKKSNQLEIINLSNRLIHNFKEEYSLIPWVSPFSEKEIKNWELSDPKNYEKDNFCFAITSGLPSNYINIRDRNAGVVAESPDKLSNKNFFSFEHRDRFSQRDNSISIICKTSQVSALETFGPGGFILKIPRENIKHTQEVNFASSNKFISRKFEVMAPLKLAESTPAGRYNEVIVEGKSPYSNEKIEIIGVFKKVVSNPTSEEGQFFQNLNEFLGKMRDQYPDFPEVLIPGEWIVPESFRNSKIGDSKKIR